MSIVFSSCSKEQESPVIQEPYMSVDEVREFVNELKFTGQLPSGQMIEFVPANFISSKTASFDYSELEQLNYVEERGLSFEIGLLNESSNGKLTISPLNSERTFDVVFDYILIITFGELKILYPNRINIDPATKNYILGLGIGNDIYDEEDVIFGSNELFGVTDLIQVVIDPQENFLEGAYLGEGEFVFPFILTGTYDYRIDRIESTGTLEYFNGAFFDELGSYDLTLQE